MTTTPMSSNGTWPPAPAQAGPYGESQGNWTDPYSTFSPGTASPFAPQPSFGFSPPAGPSGPSEVTASSGRASLLTQRPRAIMAGLAAFALLAVGSSAYTHSELGKANAALANTKASAATAATTAKSVEAKLKTTAAHDAVLAECGVELYKGITELFNKSAQGNADFQAAYSKCQSALGTSQ